MHRFLYLLIGCVLLANAALAAPKPHVVSWGKWAAAQFPADADDSKTLEIKIRPLYVDGRVKEFTFGSPHEITDRLFVVRRAFRLNDTLPQEASAAPRWRWQRGGWLLVDRVSGHISAVALPEFDADYSAGSWYRDYVAYCGVSDDEKKSFAIVAELGRRKPILKQPLGESLAEGEAVCTSLTWQRAPVRVAFTAGEGKAFTYSVRGHAVDIVTEEDQDEGTQ
jgi:hypothetical protein